MQDEMKNRPNKVFRCGAIQAAIWTNQRVMDNAVVEVHSIKIDKSYKDGDDWKRTTSFVAEDLPKVSVVTMAAYRHLRLRSPDYGSSDSENLFEAESSGRNIRPDKYKDA